MTAAQPESLGTYEAGYLAAAIDLCGRTNKRGRLVIGPIAWEHAERIAELTGGMIVANQTQHYVKLDPSWRVMVGARDE